MKKRRFSTGSALALLAVLASSTSARAVPFSPCGELGFWTRDSRFYVRSVAPADLALIKELTGAELDPALDGCSLRLDSYTDTDSGKESIFLSATTACPALKEPPSGFGSLQELAALSSQHPLLEKPGAPPAGAVPQAEAKGATCKPAGTAFQCTPQKPGAPVRVTPSVRMPDGRVYTFQSNEYQKEASAEFDFSPDGKKAVVMTRGLDPDGQHVGQLMWGPLSGLRIEFLENADAQFLGWEYLVHQGFVFIASEPSKATRKKTVVYAAKGFEQQANKLAARLPVPAKVQPLAGPSSFDVVVDVGTEITEMESLVTQMVDAQNAKKLAEARGFIDRALKLSPKNPLVLYNLACWHALKGEKTKAIESLGRAIDSGWDDWDWIVKDHDLDGVRAEPAFKTLLERKR